MFTAARSKLEPHGYDLITLSGAGQEIRILPENGMNLFSWTIDGRQVMMTPPDVTIFGTKYGTPVLFPMPNRVKDSVYRWNGREYRLTKRGAAIARHGLVCDEPFTVRRIECGDDEAMCEAAIEIKPGDGLYEGYPFACRLTLRYTLNAQGVRMDAKIENLGEEMMPFGFALHPYFSKRGDARHCFIQVPARRVYETDENLIPTGRILPANEAQNIADAPRCLDDLVLDTVFRGLTQDMTSRVIYDDLTLVIRSGDCFRNAVVFTPHDKQGFCIEPQTCATDFANLHARGLADESGLIALAAGEKFTCFCEIAVQRHAENAAEAALVD